MIYHSGTLELIKKRTSISGHVKSQMPEDPPTTNTYDTEQNGGGDGFQVGAQQNCPPEGGEVCNRSPTVAGFLPSVLSGASCGPLGTLFMGLFS